MAFSILDSFYEIDQNNYAISLVKQSKNRKNGHHGALGFLLIEKVDMANNHLLYKIDFPFGSTQDIKITALLKKDLPNKNEFLNSLSMTTTFTFSKDSVDQSNLVKADNTAHCSTTSIESSYKKAISSLEKNFGIKISLDVEDPVFIPDFRIENSPISWNPFARLIESKRFPFARLLSSSLWQRIKDCFFILNGDFIKNDLGILDYIFPIPRLLINLLAFDVSLIAKIAIGVAAAATFAIKIVLAFLTTMILSPVIGIIDLAFKLFAPANEEIDETIKVKPIKGQIESFYDVLPNDLEKETSLASFKKIYENLSIKPLAITSTHYEELTNTRALKEEDENLSFGIYADRNPLGIMELNSENKSGIFNLMRTNRYKIDTNLEKANVIFKRA